MAKKKSRTVDWGKPAKFKPGDHIRFEYAVEVVDGLIIEDRGPIGVGGRRLYGITFNKNPGQDSYIEMPEEEIMAADN